MITEALIKFMWALPKALTSLIPTLDVPNLMTNDFISFLTYVVGLVSYFLPMPVLIGCLAVMVTVRNFHIIWTIIQRVWDAIPLT